MCLSSPAWSFQFYHHQRQSIDEHSQVQSYLVVLFLHSPLVHYEERVCIHIFIAHQLHPVSTHFTIPGNFGFQSVLQGIHELFIVLNQGEVVHVIELAQGLVYGFLGYSGVDVPYLLFQLFPVVWFMGVTIHIVARLVRVTQILKELDERFLVGLFGEMYHIHNNKVITGFYTSISPDISLGSRVSRRVER